MLGFGAECEEGPWIFPRPLTWCQKFRQLPLFQSLALLPDDDVRRRCVFQPSTLFCKACQLHAEGVAPNNGSGNCWGFQHVGWSMMPPSGFRNFTPACCCLQGYEHHGFPCPCVTKNWEQPLNFGDYACRITKFKLRTLKIGTGQTIRQRYCSLDLLPRSAGVFQQQFSVVVHAFGVAVSSFLLMHFIDSFLSDLGKHLSIAFRTWKSWTSSRFPPGTNKKITNLAICLSIHLYIAN